MNLLAQKIAASVLAVGVSWCLGSSLSAQVIKVAELSAAPTLDGETQDWSAVEAVPVAVKGPIGIQSVSLKAGVHGENVYFLVQWKDSTFDDQHKPFVWNAAANKYDSGKQQEDRLALEFAMEGNYTTDWLSGQSFKSDMWHWKSARSNPIGLAHDQMTIIGLEEVKGAFKAQSKDGKTIYIQRPNDAGDELYTTARYAAKEKDLMPKYALNAAAKGSVTDIKAKGVWKEGQWTLELQRKLNTGNPDDVAFSKGAAVKGGLAVFDHTSDDQHDLSETLTFQF